MKKMEENNYIKSKLDFKVSNSKYDVLYGGQPAYTFSEAGLIKRQAWR